MCYLLLRGALREPGVFVVFFGPAGSRATLGSRFRFLCPVEACCRRSCAGLPVFFVRPPSATRSEFPPASLCQQSVLTPRKQPSTSFGDPQRGLLPAVRGGQPTPSAAWHIHAMVHGARLRGRHADVPPPPPLLLLLLPAPWDRTCAGVWIRLSPPFPIKYPVHRHVCHVHCHAPGGSR